MKLDGNFYKKELNEGIKELNTRRNNIESYLITRYGMNYRTAIKVTNILEKTSLRDDMINSGIYDSVIEKVIYKMTEYSNYSPLDAKTIQKEERDEHLHSKIPFPQSQNNIPQQNIVPLSKEEELQKQKNLEILEQMIEKDKKFMEEIRARNPRKR